MRDFGQRALKDVERQLFEPFHSVSAWFAPEVGAARRQQSGRLRLAAPTVRGPPAVRELAELVVPLLRCVLLVPLQVKLGSLAGSMEAPACFGAEIYAQVWRPGSADVPYPAKRMACWQQPANQAVPGLQGLYDVASSQTWRLHRPGHSTSQHCLPAISRRTWVMWKHPST